MKTPGEAQQDTFHLDTTSREKGRTPGQLERPCGGTKPCVGTKPCRAPRPEQEQQMQEEEEDGGGGTQPPAGRPAPGRAAAILPTPRAGPGAPRPGGAVPGGGEGRAAAAGRRGRGRARSPLPGGRRRAPPGPAALPAAILGEKPGLRRWWLLGASPERGGGHRRRIQPVAVTRVYWKQTLLQSGRR